MEKSYLESFVNYWVDLFGRGIGAIYVKDRNPSADPWRMKEFKFYFIATIFLAICLLICGGMMCAFINIAEGVR